MEFLRQRASIEIQRGNAAAVMETVETGMAYFCSIGIFLFLVKGVHTSLARECNEIFSNSYRFMLRLYFFAQ